MASVFVVHCLLCIVALLTSLLAQSTQNHLCSGYVQGKHIKLHIMLIFYLFTVPQETIEGN